MRLEDRIIRYIFETGHARPYLKYKDGSLFSVTYIKQEPGKRSFWTEEFLEVIMKKVEKYEATLPENLLSLRKV